LLTDAFSSLRCACGAANADVRHHERMASHRVRPIFRWLAGFLAIGCLISGMVFAYLGFTATRTSEVSWFWWAILEFGMAYVFGYAALRGRDPYRPEDVQEARDA